MPDRVMSEMTLTPVSDFTQHAKTHNGEKPYGCQTWQQEIGTAW